jgi:hypothetical protein
MKKLVALLFIASDVVLMGQTPVKGLVVVRAERMSKSFPPDVVFLMKDPGPWLLRGSCVAPSPDRKTLFAHPARPATRNSRLVAPFEPGTPGTNPPPMLR